MQRRRQLGFASTSMSKFMRLGFIAIIVISLGNTTITQLKISRNYNHFDHFNHFDQLNAPKSTPEFEDEDFPYPLTCKKSELYNFLQRNKLIDKAGGRLTFNVALAMHVGMVGHWPGNIFSKIKSIR